MKRKLFRTIHEQQFWNTLEVNYTTRTRLYVSRQLILLSKLVFRAFSN